MYTMRMLTTKKVLKRLKALREKRSLLQEQVARCLGIDRTTYVRKEKGLIPITTDEWLQLAVTMKEDPAFFFSASDTANNDSETVCDEE